MPKLLNYYSKIVCYTTLQKNPDAELSDKIDELQQQNSQFHKENHAFTNKSTSTDFLHILDIIYSVKFWYDVINFLEPINKIYLG